MNELDRSTPKRNGWKTNVPSVLLGQVIMFVFWLAGYIFTQGVRQQQASEMGQRVSVLEAKVVEMSKEGTVYSHWQIRPLLDANTERLKSLELKLNKYDVVVEKVDRLEGELKELKSHK